LKVSHKCGSKCICETRSIPAAKAEESDRPTHTLMVYIDNHFKSVYDHLKRQDDLLKSILEEVRSIKKRVVKAEEYSKVQCAFNAFCFI
jgi:hypothetical protein